ncbi:carboxy-S-adenosyl-L-methionine synthase-like [Oscarella lobularis]|uniref:carboxy-S-adenosyl-L-methionine synthase-like n=1 Tax=Oscarella lobularis TaxID=121494 RepID=UPI0033136803
MTSYASNYQRFSQFTQQSDAANFLDNALQPVIGDRILDFGCGTGNVLIDLARRVGSTGFVVGIDPDEDRIKVAKRRLDAHAAHANVEVHLGSVDESAKYAPYDVINSNHVMHWILPEEHEKILRRIYGQLRPGGRFGFTTIRELTGYIRDVSATQYENSYDDFLSAVGWAYRPLSYWEKLLTDAGFEIVCSAEEERAYFVPNCEALLTWWESTSLGCFNAAPVIEDTEGDYEKLLKKHRWKKDEPIPTSAIHVDVVARKP